MVKRMLFDYAFQSKSYYLQGGSTTHALWDTLVFAKVWFRITVMTCLEPTSW